MNNVKKVDILRKKYPKFCYQGYSHKISSANLEIFFNFKIGSINFKPKIIIKNLDDSVIKKRLSLIGDSALNNLIFHLGLMEIPSYWKAFCSPVIEIKAGYLDKEQIKWWEDFIINGMTQFFYENKINFQNSNFLKIISNQTTKLGGDPFSTKLAENGSPPASALTKNRYLIPMGEGKDSIVTLESIKTSLKRLGLTKPNSINCFVVNSKKQHLKIFKIAGIKHPIFVERKVAPLLLKLNQKGFLNGHTPITATISNLAIFCAVLFRFDNVVMSCERSADEGNVKYLGKTINHQWSKSFEFEKKFRNYLKKYSAKDLPAGKRSINYFSFLRPLYELQIAKIFSNIPKYLHVFLSCNEARKTKSGTEKPSGKWCGKCPKCLFIWTILYPFVDEKKLFKVFSKNLFENKKLLRIMKELIGEEATKPFECVGTKKECLIAFYLSWKKKSGREQFSAKLPFLLEYFEKEILPKYPNLERESKKMLNSWNKQNYLPKNLEKILLKNEIKNIKG